MLIQAAMDRGIKIKNTSQYNQGGNTDFLNMTAEHRLKYKLASKQESVIGLFKDGQKLEQESYFGPGEGIGMSGKKGHGWRDGQKDEKIAVITLDGEMWGGIPCKYRINLTVEDSPDSAGIAADAIRCAKLALDAGVSGAVDDASFYFFKHPPRQIPDIEAKERLAKFISACQNTRRLERPMVRQ
jgi:myo-inositol-1-phosphate synthase